MKEVKVAFSEIKCVNLKENTIEILGIHFSNNEERNMDKKFLTGISNFQNVQNMVMKNVTLEGKIIVFRTLTLSKMVH